MIGAMRELLTLQTNAAVAIAIVTLTRVGVTATAVTRVPHGYVTGDYATVAKASPAGYNGKVKVAVTGPSSFTYTVSSALAATATGTITVTYASDTHSGQSALVWRDLGTIWAEFLPIRTTERLQLAAIEDAVVCRFRVRARADLAPGVRVQWKASWPQGSPERVLKVAGVLRDDENLSCMVLDCREVTL